MSDRTIYVKDATARNLDSGRSSDIYDQSEVLRLKKTQRARRKSQQKLLIMIAGFFVLAALVTCRYALIYEQAGQLSALGREYENRRNANIQLEAEIEKRLDLGEIRTIAEEKLGMYKPGRNQIIYIKLPQADYVRAKGQPEGEKTFLDTLLGVVSVAAGIR
ncbi:MAG TPA: hypothetical protein DD727_09480 [Clostridiales bacterium]|nr:hypothetical protein [Clostridiales bacterium]